MHVLLACVFCMSGCICIGKKTACKAVNASVKVDVLSTCIDKQSNFMVSIMDTIGMCRHIGYRGFPHRQLLVERELQEHHRQSCPGTVWYLYRQRCQVHWLEAWS